MTEREVFQKALEIEDPAERAAFLDRAYADQPELRRQMDQLLNAHDQAGEFLGRPHPAAENAGTPTAAYLSESAPEETAGMVIAGKYKLLQRIGNGAMGSVWMANQLEPVKRRVAVKLIRTEREGSRTILSRFEAERQAIALMDHPHIAKLLDAGTVDCSLREHDVVSRSETPTIGRPYFVMELVKGVPLTEFCDEHKLSIPERLNLFMQICSAVQHAHQKGIIHRDLKPTNILVETHDDKPVPKVIDFGLAKAMSGQPLTEHTLFTGFGTVAGTPLYMAPEQAKFNAIDIDTRADIYALGVILYELLTGSTPIERATLKKAALDEILRVIRESDPPTPSKRLSTTESTPSVAANRLTEPEKLGRFVKGELDWIVMKALAKERERRYETANGFAKDIERFLNREPVLAGPPSASYRLRKFVERNRVQVIAATVVLIALVGGTAGTTIGLIRAEHERGLAEASARKATEAAEAERRAKVDAEERREEAERERSRAEVREQLAIDGVKRFGDAVANDPDLKNNPKLASLRKTLLQEPLGFFRTLRDRLEADRDTRPESLARLAGVAYDLGMLTDEIGNKEDALMAYGHALGLFERLVRENPAVTRFQSQLSGSYNTVGVLLTETGKPGEALAAYERAKAIFEQLVRENPTVTEFQHYLAASHNNIGNLLSVTGKPAEALAAYEQAKAILEQLVRDNPSVTDYQSGLANTHNSIGVLRSATGKPGEALAAYERAKAIRERLVRENPAVTKFQSQLAGSYINIGNLLYATGRPANALAAHEQAKAIEEQLVRENPTVTEFQSRLATSHNNIGALLSETGKPTEALAAHEQAKAIVEQLVRENPAVTEFQSHLAGSQHNIGNMLSATGKAAEAMAAYEQAITIRERLVREYPTVTEFQSALGGTLNDLATVENDSAQFDKARDRLREAIRWQKQALATNVANPTYRQFLKNHYTNLLVTADGLGDKSLEAEARQGLAEFAASDPQLQAIDRRITEVLAGAQPTGAAELLAMAQRAYDTRRFIAATRFFADALSADPTLAESRQRQYRYDAACCAALAWAGQAIDDPQPDPVAKTKLRSQALGWLQAELDTWTTLLERATDQQRTFIAATLKHWQRDADLASLRDASELEKIPEEERTAWQALWRTVEERLRESAAQSDPEKAPNNDE